MSAQVQMCPTQKNGKPILEFRVTFPRELAPDPKSTPEFSVKFVQVSKPPKETKVSGKYDATGEVWLVCAAQEEFVGDVGISVSWTTGPATPTPGRGQHLSHWFRPGTKVNHQRVRVVLPQKPKTIAIVLDGVPQADEDILRHYAGAMGSRHDVRGVQKITAAAGSLAIKIQAERYVETFRKAVEDSGVGGIVVLAAGHGTHANQAYVDVLNHRVPFVHFDLVAAAELQVDPEILDPALVSADAHWMPFVNEDGSLNIPPSPPAPPDIGDTIRTARRRSTVREVLREMRIALWNSYAKELVIAACGVGADPGFVQALADNLGVRVRATSHWVMVSRGMAAIHSTSPEGYRLDTETPINDRTWAHLHGTNPVKVGEGLVFGGQVVCDPASTPP